ncbi:helix-turn-helix domain-containing protein [Leptolyngbya sp. FACHB-261]|uniref:helix-turn-helix domain-containing protein n=1 Tax=Leptolyngbya sp. FACHB-261 TaxID=2692806 RepID=UPI001687E8D8|nr:AraC family transcriptional regulator [Leptolyngbya sp. FACHB-261]MBD2102660.1 helix-turn-helix transcriptional regulator [Leptolyngbya sp. FACHB-261]
MTASSHTIDFTQEDHLSLPCLPLVSSCRAGWNKIQLALYRQPSYCIPEHYSPHHVICINAGTPVTLQQTIDGQSQTIDSVPGDVGIYPANRWQTFYWHQEAEFLQLYLEPMLLNQLGAELYEKDSIELIPQLTSCFDPLIYQIAIALKTTLETGGIGSKLYSDSMANALAVHLLYRYSTHKSSIQHYSGRLSHQQLRQVINYIDEHLDQDLSLAELATLTQLSSYHFARLFKQSTGIAPHQYHIKCRVERAKQLLLARQLSIAEVAQVVGFASQGHLNYHFKRVTGVTPKAFLRQ